MRRRDPLAANHVCGTHEADDTRAEVRNPPPPAALLSIPPHGWNPFLGSPARVLPQIEGFGDFGAIPPGEFEALVRKHKAKRRAEEVAVVIGVAGGAAAGTAIGLAVAGERAPVSPGKP